MIIHDILEFVFRRIRLKRLRRERERRNVYRRLYRQFSKQAHLSFAFYSEKRRREDFERRREIVRARYFKNHRRPSLTPL